MPQHEAIAPPVWDHQPWTNNNNLVAFPSKYVTKAYHKHLIINKYSAYVIIMTTGGYFTSKGMNPGSFLKIILSKP